MREDAGEIDEDGIDHHDKNGPRRIPKDEDTTGEEHRPVGTFRAAGFEDEAGEIL